MSKLGRQAAKAEAGVAHLESALEKTQKALHAAEVVDAKAAAAKKKSGKLVKVVLLLAVVGLGVVIARKLLGDSGSTPAPSPSPRPVDRTPAGSNGASSAASSTGSVAEADADDASA